jgi:translation initiation factor 4A
MTSPDYIRDIYDRIMAMLPDVSVKIDGHFAHAVRALQNHVAEHVPASSDAQVLIADITSVRSLVYRSRKYVESVKVLIAVEANGFPAPDLEWLRCIIENHLPKQAQVCSCSQIALPALVEMTSNRSRNQIVITADAHQPSFDDVHQSYLSVEKEEWKVDTVCDLMETITVNPCLVLCRSERSVQNLARELQRRDLPGVVALASGLVASERHTLVQRLTVGGDIRCLVAPFDSIGFADVPKGAYAILFDLPGVSNPDDYLYAVGRRERQSRSGTGRSHAIVFVTNNDVRDFKEICRHFGFVGANQIEETPMDIADLI